MYQFGHLAGVFFDAVECGFHRQIVCLYVELLKEQLCNLNKKRARRSITNSMAPAINTIEPVLTTPSMCRGEP